MHRIQNIDIRNGTEPQAVEIVSKPNGAYGNLQVRKGAKRSAPPLKLQLCWG
jgi:hypothetical protein